MISGVYKIECLVNKKIYIGSSYHVENRFKDHITRLNKNNHRNKHLQNAWNLYGENNFMFYILEECSVEGLIQNEQKWMDNLKSYDRNIGYNICKSSSYTSINAKEYIVTTPEGVEIEVSNLEKFSRGNNISRGLHRVAIGTANQHKGYLCRYKTDTIEDWIKRKRRGKRRSGGWQGKYKLIFKNGEILLIESLIGYCRDNNLCRSSLDGVKSGKRKRYKNIIKVEKYEGSNIWNTNDN